MLDQKLHITEIFYSIQGESIFAGCPCSFIRLIGCNLNCHYCDTPESRSIQPSSKYMSLDEILSQVASLGCSLVEITGGEPLLQSATPMLCQRLLEEGYTVLLETNGSLSLKEVPGNVIKIMDIKTPSSGMSQFFLPDNLRYLKKSDQIKFVLSHKEDFDWACLFLKQSEIPEGVEVLFSSVVPDLDPSYLARWILEKKMDVRLQIQLHKLLKLP